MNKVFTSLGYKVFDFFQIPAFWESFEAYGKKKISNFMDEHSWCVDNYLYSLFIF